MTARRPVAFAAALLIAMLAPTVPGGPIPPMAASDHYALVTSAAYEVDPAAGHIEVSVDVTFTNTTPDPAGQFSVFEEVKLAVHDQAADAQASDADGELEVSLAVEDEVNVATIPLRDPVRYEESAEFELTYTLPDTDDPRLRVRPSLVIFPAWSFGTLGEVTVSLPAGYEVRVDGDLLTAASGDLVSGEIPDPSQWLSLVTAVRSPEYVTSSAIVPLVGGTADLRVRAFSDDAAWGERTLALVERALPLLEEEIGLPYPRLGDLVLTESVLAGTSDGFGERSSPNGAEILIAFDQPPFTTLHQVAHVWLSDQLIAARWIREGMASEVAARIAERVEVSPPYDPAAVAAEQQAAAFPLDAWPADAGAPAETFGYAASWNTVAELRARAGDEALRQVLARVAAGVGPYQAAKIGPRVAAPNETPAIEPLTSRSFLDHLQTVSGTDVTDLFRDRVLTPEDAALLEPRAAARAAFDELVAAAHGWGAPDPVRAAMNAWNFEEAQARIGQARAWLADADILLAEMAEAGLSAPERLQQAYRADGGDDEAYAELERERTVVEAYVATAEQVNAERSFVERVGLIGAPDPAAQLAVANGRFAEGDLTGAVSALADAERLLTGAEAAGFARLASVTLVALVLLGLAVLLVRRRAAYTPRR